MSTGPDFAVDDGRLLAGVILSLPSPALATVLALLEETHLSQVAASRLRDLIGRSEGSFQAILAERTEVLSRERAGELALRLYGELNHVLELPGCAYVALRDFEDNAAEIVARACEVLHRHEQQFTGTRLQDLVEFQTRRMLAGLEVAFEAMSQEQQTNFLERIRAFVKSLPAEQQERVKRELGADELTDAILKKAIATGALATAFAGAVDLAGFAFYTTAVSLMAHLAGVVGITLPFSAYTTLTSAIAVLSNPLFIMVALGGGGFMLYRRHDAALRERLVPCVVAHLAVAHLAREEGRDARDATDEAIRLWSEARVRRDERRIDWQRAEAELERERGEAARAEEDVGAAKVDLVGAESTHEAALTALRLFVREQVAVIAEGRWGADLVPSARLLLQAVHLTEEAKQGIAEDGSGWFTRAASTASRQIRGMLARREMERCLTGLVELVLERRGAADASEDPPLALTRELRAAEARRAEAEAAVAMRQARKREADEEVRARREVAKVAKALAEEAGRRYFGLATCQ